MDARMQDLCFMLYACPVDAEGGVIRAAGQDRAWGETRAHYFDIHG